MFGSKIKEAVLLTTITTVNERLVPLLPEGVKTNYSLVFANGRNYFGDELTGCRDGDECLVYITYPIEQNDLVRSHKSFIGSGNSVLNNKDYKRLVGERPEGEDAIWVFLNAGYKDEDFTAVAKPCKDRQCTVAVMDAKASIALSLIIACAIFI